MKHLSFFAIISFVLFSCSSPSGESTVAHNESHHEMNHDDGVNEPIELNQGEKWVINDAMRPFIAQNEALINTFIQNGDTDYMQLSEQLKKNNDQLVQSCTMDGKSHEELHKWLHPHLEWIDALSKSKNQDEAMEIVHRIHASNELFHQYFI